MQLCTQCYPTTRHQPATAKGSRLSQSSTTKKQPHPPDIFLDTNASKTKQSTLTFPKESPCFPIAKEDITLVGKHSSLFQSNLQATLASLHYKKDGECLGVQGINLLTNTLQNSIIADGYTTSRVLVSSQDLSNKKLTLTFIPGLVDKIRFVDDSSPTSLASAMPLQSEEILNLRDIEQGLENLKRIPSADASMQIEPSRRVGYSDVVITYTHKNPFRFNFSLDDSGTKSTGKVQGGATLSVDNPLGLNDIFYYSSTSGIADITNATLGSQSESGLSHNEAFGYSIPYGYWLLSLASSKYHYEQAVVGASQIYNYSGNSQSSDATLSRVIYRDASKKLTASLKAWQKSSDSFIDDAKIDVQSRKTGGYEVGLALRDYLSNNAVLDIGGSFKRGTGAFGAMRAPEEIWDEGTSRMKIYQANISLNAPFMLFNNNFTLNTSTQLQYNKTPLVVQDCLSLGGRYSVRGFSGDYTLIGEKGVLSRNEFDWNYNPSHMLYLGLDGGHIAGKRADTQIGKTLIGSALGIRGSFAKSGVLSYDLFVGFPLLYPTSFPKDSITSGFSINYSF